MKNNVLMRYLYILLLFIASLQAAAAQDRAAYDSIRYAGIEKKLQQVAEADPTYLEEVDISVGKLPLSDMLRNVAKIAAVNLTVKGAENTMVTCNFSRAKITDLIFFLCREYDLDIDVVGNIVAIRPAAPMPDKPKIPNISYSPKDKSVDYDLNGDKLIDVIKKFADEAKINIVAPTSMYSTLVSGYVSKMPLDEAVSTLASINGIEAAKAERGVWEFSPAVSAASQDGRGGGASAPVFTRRTQFAPNQVMVDSMGLVTVQVGRGNIQDIVTELCVQQGLNYFFLSPMTQQTSVFVRGVSFQTILGVLFAGTSYSYYEESGIYFFGDGSKSKGISGVKVIPMINRSVNKVEELIPESLKTGVQLKTFVDQNSIIAAGDHRLIGRIETFLQSIDKRVPLVTIEVIIADVTKSNIMETGIEMGLGDPPAKTSGTLSPGLSLNMNAQTVNNLINSFNGFGSINLGRVTPDFYMSLQFLEENGTITLHSTPKLSTLNGHEANLKSGQKRYYKEITNTIVGSNNPITNESYQWKNIEANLSVKITPFVSKNRDITLDIEIEQSEFVETTTDGEPPGTATRTFKSQIRVQNEEMVLLGGIDRNSHNKTASGLPFIARVPVLKWLFGKSKNNKVDQRLNVFIKPTLVD